MNLTEAKNIYMIGIKGVGMTMLAQYLSEKGANVTGSDTPEVFMTDQVLKKAGVNIIEDFKPENIPDDSDYVIYSTAYAPERNIEVKIALESNKKVLTYAQALGEVFNEKFGIAVVGSHGKTTTTAWLGYVLNKAGLSPSVMVGANVPQFDGTSLVGVSDRIIIEADEYQNKLKYFNPKMVLINNIDYDHPDFFPTETDYENVFIEFIKKIPQNGTLIANFDDPIIKKIANVNTRGKVVSYAINEAADYVAYDIKNQNGKQYFKVKIGAGEGDEDDSLSSAELGDFVIELQGTHNIYNALAVIAASIEFGIDLSALRTYLEEFTGTTRRMEVMGEWNGAIIIDDYAHHPTEVKSTLEAVKTKYKNNKIITVFHPHTYTRTKALLDKFAQSFGSTDTLIILDIYGSAREQQGGVHTQDIIDKIKSLGIEKQPKETIYIPDLAKCEQWIRENVERGDIVLLMGAGDVFRIGNNLTE